MALTGCQASAPRSGLLSVARTGRRTWIAEYSTYGRVTWKRTFATKAGAQKALERLIAESDQRPTSDWRCFMIPED